MNGHMWSNGAETPKNFVEKTYNLQLTPQKTATLK